MSNVQIILLKKVENLGEMGEIVQVKSGFARNYLLPQKLAALPGSAQARETLLEIKQKKMEKLKQIEVKKEKKETQEKKRQAMIKRRAELLSKK